MADIKKTNFWEFFQDVDNSLSFKRLQTGFFVILFGVLFFSNLFFHLTTSDVITETLVTMIIYGFTGITSEKFTKRGIVSIKDPEDTQQK